MAIKLGQKFSRDLLAPVCAGRKRGQAMVEYIIVAGALVLCTFAISLFLNTFKSNSNRVVELSASEYP